MLSILSEYDIFLVDAYGVFWDGSNFISGTKETLQTLVKNGKHVIIVSNTTQLSNAAIQKYTQAGLFKGQHYHELVTSGDVIRKELAEGLVINGQKLTRYYSFGVPNNILFEGLEYKVSPLNEAEFIYIGIPQFTNSQKEALSNKYKFYESCLSKPGGEIYWDTAEIEAFLTMMEEIAAYKLPILNANPDLMAPEKCRATNSVNFVIRQGSIARALEQRNLKTYQFGKPHNNIYSFCRNILSDYINLSNTKIAMVGDTLETDILGAHNATNQLNWKIDSILTLTGNAGRNLTNHHHLEVSKKLTPQFEQLGCKPNHIISSFGIDGKIIT